MRVLVGGVFDIIHPGHIFFLNKAAAYGDELIVIVATDKTAGKNKGRDPIFNQSERLELVQSLEMVTKAVPGNPGDFLNAVKEQNPDIIILGYDQDFPDLGQKLADQNLGTKVVRLMDRLDDYSTTNILEKIHG